MPLHGIIAVDLGYQPGIAVSNLGNKMHGPPFKATYLRLLNQIWQDTDKVEDATTTIVDHIATVYQENSPPVSSTSSKPTAAASWPTAWPWARPSSRWPSSITTSGATARCWR